MTNKRKKEFEIKKIRLFLTHFGCRIKSIKKWETDPPDAIAIIRLPKRKKWRIVAIEEREYFSDAPVNEESKGQRLYNFWATINRSIVRRIAKRSSISNINASIQLNENTLLQTCESLQKTKGKKRQFDNLAKSIAKELVDLALESCSEDNFTELRLVYGGIVRSDKARIPNKYTFLNKFIKGLTLKKANFSTIKQKNKNKWHANVNAAHIAISPDKLAGIIQEKNKKYKECNSCNIVDECWLLITAPGTTSHNAMHSFPQYEDWDDAKLIDECKSAVFSKIFFWCGRPVEWHRQIWPKRP